MNRYRIVLSAPAAILLAACGSNKQAQVPLPATQVYPSTYVSSTAPVASVAQTGTMSIPTNSHLVFRTHEGINTNSAMDQSFYAEVAKDVFDSSGQVLIPSGSPAKLVVIRTEKVDKVTGMPELVLGLRSIMVSGKSYGLSPSGWTSADMQRPGTTMQAERGVGYDSRQMSSNPESELRDDRVTGYSNLPGYDSRRADMRGYDPRGYVDPRDYLRRGDRVWQGTAADGMIVGELISAIPGQAGSSSVIGTPTGAYREPEAGRFDPTTGTYRGSYSDSATPIYGAGSQVMIRGPFVRVPANSVLTFRLDQPLQLFTSMP